MFSKLIRLHLTLIYHHRWTVGGEGHGEARGRPPDQSLLWRQPYFINPVSYVDSSVVVDGLPRLTMPSDDAYLQENTEALRPSSHAYSPLLQQSSKHRKKEIKEGFLREVAKFKTRGARYGSLWVLNLKGGDKKKGSSADSIFFFYHKCAVNEKILILKIPENYCNSQIRPILMIFFSR